MSPTIVNSIWNNIHKSLGWFWWTISLPIWESWRSWKISWFGFLWIQWLYQFSCIYKSILLWWLDSRKSLALKKNWNTFEWHWHLTFDFEKSIIRRIFIDTCIKDKSVVSRAQGLIFAFCRYVHELVKES